MTGINSIRNIEESSLNKEDKNKTEEQYVMDFVKEIDEIEKMLIPIREHRSEVKKLFIENGWLTKKDITSIMKAYRSLKNEDDLGKIADYYKILQGKLK